MKEFQNKVAVITGAASGIGRAMAERFAREGMRVVLADIEAAALAQTEKEMRVAGETVLAVQTDVSKASDVEALAQKTFSTFGAAHVLCNNAGVSNQLGPALWECSLAEWEWVMGVNLWGVIHGIHAFVPRMLAQNTEAHIVNTASIAGLLSTLGIYGVTKHAVVALSENLFLEFKQRHAPIKVSVLCPAWVNTRISDADRNAPAEIKSDPPVDPGVQARRDAMRAIVRDGLAPSQVAEQVLAAVRDEKFYILTHPEMKRAVQKRVEIILAEGHPRGAMF